VNDWLGENVNGKGKTIEMQVPVSVGARRAKDGTYLVVVTVLTGTAFKGKAKGGEAKAGEAKGGGTPGGGTPGQFPGFGGKKGGLGGPKLTILGDEWSLDLIVGGKNPNEYLRNQFELPGVSVADAEKLVDMVEATVKGKIQEVRLVNAVTLQVVVGDVLVDGKNMAQRKPESGPFGIGAPK
jgi:hypothetical protein